MAVTALSAARQGIFKFSLVAILAMSGVNLAFSILNINTAVSAEAATRSDKFTHILSKRSIIVISFDGISEVAISDLLSESTRNTKAPKGLYLFQNTFS